MTLSGKTIIITGISKGIGRSLALLLLEKGARVAGLGVHAPDYDHENLLFIPCNIRKAAEVERAFSLIREKWGPETDVLVNNAGLGYFGFIENMPDEQWHEMFDTNIHGMFYCCKQVIPQMKKQQHGHIVNIASTAALEGMAQVAAYSASKWAVKGFSESLFRELRDERVKVTCVYPGSTKTDFFRNSPGIQAHDYMLMPDDVALGIIQALETPANFNTLNLEIRPLQPKGPKK